MDVVTATRNFEKWVGRRLSAVKDQLSRKHRLMAASPVQFLRGTFYRWTQRFPEVCSELNDAPAVLAVGDLHIESFGTWRDSFGRLIWGIDDLDEAWPLPYTNDLVRLAASSVLDSDEGEIAVSLRNVTDVIVDGYTAGLKAGGKPFVLGEQHKWLRKIALDRLDIPAEFWRKMEALPAARGVVPPGARRAIAGLLPDPRLPYRMVRRTAGIGSQGHPRFVAVAEWHGGQIALEAKAAIPSACAWAMGEESPRIYYEVLLKQAVRCPDPLVRLDGKWLVRHLAPDSSPIEIETMSGRKDQDKLLHAMAWEAANLHLGTRRAGGKIISHLNRLSAKKLRTAVWDMVKATTDDWKEWKRRHH